MGLRSSWHSFALAGWLAALARDIVLQAMDGPRNPVLEDLIADDPDNSGSIQLVYGDWLSDRGSSWGELIALQHALIPPDEAPLFEWDDPGGISAAVAQRPTDLELYSESSGSLAPNDTEEQVGNDREQFLRAAIEAEIFPFESRPRVVWRRGFIDKVFLPQHAGFRDGLEETLISLLEHPAALALRELALGEIEWGRSSRSHHRGLHYLDEIDVLTVLAPRALRRLVLGAWQEHDISWTAIGDLSPLYGALPQLRELELQGGIIELGALELPQLRRLLIRCGGLSAEALESLHNARCPALESLTVWFGRVDYGGSADVQACAPFLDGKLFPRLRRLGLANAEFTDAVCERLPGSAVLRQLSHIDLSLGTMSDAGAKILLRQRAAFEHLEQIDVRSNSLSAAMCARLEDAFANVDTRFQKRSRRYRYATVGE